MAPDKKRGRRSKAIAPKATKQAAPARSGRPYDIAFFKRGPAEDPKETMPGREFLNSVPESIRAQFRAVLIAVAEAPPHRFAGGGKWEAMHGSMTGYFEVRIDGPGRTHYRLFCRLDTEAPDRGPILVVIDGAIKPFRTEMPEKVYARVRRYGNEYLSTPDRSLG